jgi:hypothetical protein
MKLVHSCGDKLLFDMTKQEFGLLWVGMGKLRWVAHDLDARQLYDTLAKIYEQNIGALLIR